jgi:hypothetical protein
MGTTAATFSLSLSITGPLPDTASLGNLAVVPQQNGSANFTATPGGQFIYSMLLPASYGSTSDLLVSVLANSSDSSPYVLLEALQYWPTLGASYLLFPQSSWLLANGKGGASL